MTIHHFAGSQNAVFVPALLLLLVATVAICLPIVLAPGIRKAGRSRPVAVVAGLVAVAALGAAAVGAGAAFRDLGSERAAVRAELRERYGLALDSAQVGELIDGGAVLEHLPAQEAAAGLVERKRPYRLALKSDEQVPGTYLVTLGGKRLPTV